MNKGESYIRDELKAIVTTAITSLGTWQLYDHTSCAEYRMLEQLASCRIRYILYSPYITGEF